MTSHAMKGDHHAPDVGGGNRSPSLVSCLKKLMEFKSKISKRGTERYYINVPTTLTNVAKEYHGKYVYVVVYSADVVQAESQSNK